MFIGIRPYVGPASSACLGATPATEWQLLNGLRVENAMREVEGDLDLDLDLSPE